jgi:predicted Zn-dependent protease
MSRLDQLSSMLRDDPDDLFLNFALAMELAKEQRLAEALTAFDRVLELDAGHSPGYFQKANTLIRMGRKQEAARTFEEGIRAAQARGDTHAADEMRKLLSAMNMD